VTVEQLFEQEASFSLIRDRMPLSFHSYKTMCGGCLIGRFAQSERLQVVDRGRLRWTPGPQGLEHMRARRLDTFLDDVPRAACPFQDRRIDVDPRHSIA